MKYNLGCRARDPGGQGFLLISQSTFFFRAIYICRPYIFGPGKMPVLILRNVPRHNTASLTDKSACVPQDFSGDTVTCNEKYKKRRQVMTLQPAHNKIHE